MKQHEQLSRDALIRQLQELEQTVASLQQPGHGSTKDRAEEALRESEERMRAILNTAVEGIITIDERGIIEFLNPAAEKIFGYKSAEVAGNNVSLLMPSPYREEHDKYLANYQRTGNAKIIGIGREVTGQRKDGTVFPMDLSVSEVRLLERRLFTGFVRDITERKRLEKEILEISEREQQRIGQDLHDGICQHLAGIELMCQVLDQQLRNKSPREAHRASEIATHVREAITQTRNLARGLSPVELDADGLMSALENLVDSVQKVFRIDCRFVCDKPVQVRSPATANNLYRIAQEAINNAIKHGKAARIIITLAPLNGGGSLCIEDDGCGMPTQTSTSRGMGLRIMNFRAGIIGGGLEIGPAPGKGTRVTCSFKEVA